MAVELKTCVFIHNIKTGGRTVTQALLQCVEGAKGVGPDPFHHGAHFPIKDESWSYKLFEEKWPFGFLREPVSWIRSLWLQRQRKGFNWQDNSFEQKTKSNDLNQFAYNWLYCPNFIYEYQRYNLTLKYKLCNRKEFNFKPVQFLKFNLMSYDLIRFLRYQGEDFNVNEENFKQALTKVVGTAAKPDDPLVLPWIQDEIRKNEEVLSKYFPNKPLKDFREFADFGEIFKTTKR